MNSRSSGRVSMGLEVGMGCNEKEKEQRKDYNGVRGWNGL